MKDVWVLALGASIALLGCSSKEEVQPTPYVGTVELAVTLPSGRAFSSVTYDLKRAGGYSTSGAFTTSSGRTTLHGTIDNIPVGTNYQLQIDAAPSDRGTHCTASTKFGLTSHQVLMANLIVKCPDGTTTMPSDDAGMDGSVDGPVDAGGEGSVDAGGDAGGDAVQDSGGTNLKNMCPVIEDVTATASDTMSAVLHVTASDPDEGPAALTYSWTASDGTLIHTSTASPSLTCPIAGGDLTINVTVSDSICSDRQSLLVQCRGGGTTPPPPICKEDTAPVLTPSDSEAVAFQIDAQHSGSQPNDTLRLPLAVRWSHDFAAGSVSYPLVASGRVFVTVAHKSSSGSALYALDAASGDVLWGPVEMGGTFSWSAATYASDRVFAINDDGLMSAYAADSGSQLWVSKMPGQYSFSSPPTAYGGRVYVGGAGSGGTLYGVDADSGQVLWKKTVENGDDSSPAVSASGVFVSYACNQTYGFSLACGTALWHHSGDCEGGGGATVALLDDRVYTRDSLGDLVLDAKSGALIGNYASTVIPAGANGILYTLVDGKISARGASAATPTWTFGDGSLRGAPLRVGAHVVVGSESGDLSVLSADDGSLVSSHNLSDVVTTPPDTYFVSALAGMAAAGNQLYVPAGTYLIAF